MSQRQEFVLLATAQGANIRDLCRRFSIAPATGYKWIARYSAGGVAALEDRSRRPHRSPSRTDAEVEAAVLALRTTHPAWGGRVLRARLLALGHDTVPAASTITEILHRHDRIAPQASAAHRPWTRFEHAEPNQLWQMDFKGEFATRAGMCYPLTVLDDHSRFALGLVACGDQRTETTRAALEPVLRRYGLPCRMTMDNGRPWAVVSGGRSHHTHFAVWLMRLGITVTHSRPYHPQTQGKDERFHRTLGVEVLGRQVFSDLAACQRGFDDWREVYNCQRPHHALGLEVPASRYAPSRRQYPSQLPPIAYPSTDEVRRVQTRGQIKYQQRRFFVGNAFVGLPVGLRPTSEDGVVEVYFCHQRIARLDLRAVPSAP